MKTLFKKIALVLFGVVLVGTMYGAWDKFSPYNQVFKWLLINASGDVNSTKYFEVSWGIITAYVPLLDGSGNTYTTGGAITTALSGYLTGTNWTKTWANIYNNNTGNVGVWTTTPSEQLTVVWKSYSLPNNTGSIQSGSIFKVNPSNSSVTTYLWWASSIGNWIQVSNENNLSINYPLLLNPNWGNIWIWTTTPTAKLQVNGDAIFGNYLSGSYTKFDGSGFMQSYWDAIVWNDIVWENYYGAAVSQRPVLEAMNGWSIMTQCFDNGWVTEIFGRFEKPHNATDTGYISPHLHWMWDVDSATTTWVIFYTYSFIEPWKLPTPEITITGYMSNGIVAWSWRIDDIDWDIYDSGVVLWGAMMYRVWRDATIAEDTYAGNMCIEQIGLHYRTDRRGSRQERVR